MDGPRFEWDPAKDAANRRNHGLSFEEAATVFEDENGLLMNDPEHSDLEDRLVLLGVSARQRILMVCHCYREADDVIRLISARRASRQERATYRRRL